MSAVNFAQPSVALLRCNLASGERNPSLLADLTVNRQNIKLPTQTEMIGTGNVAEVRSSHAPAPLEGNPQLPGPSQPRGENSGDDQQQPSAGKKLSSRYRGVCWNKKNKRWQAAINSSGKYLYLGSYVLEEDAARAFDKAAIRIRGRKARINFKFDEYLPELKLHSQSQCQAQHPNLKEELGNVGQDSHGLGPTITTRVQVPYHQDCQFTSARSDQQHRPYGGFQGRHVHHSNPSEREAVINGVPLHRDDRVRGARLDLATPLRSETLWGRVLTSNAECGTADVSFPLPALGLHPEHQARAQQQYMDVGLPVQNGQCQTLAVTEPHSVQNIHPSQPQDPYKFPLVAGSSAPKALVQNPPPDQPADPMRKMPSDCQIVNIIPNACGVFGMMYARPGCVNTGALIWDGHAAHNLGMFSTRDDAQQACTAASLIVVKIVQQALQGPSINYTGTAMPNHVQDGPKMESQLVQDLKPPVSAPTTSVPCPQQVANPERLQPQQSPLGCPNPENFLRLMSSITSEDIGKILHGNHVGEVQSEKGTSPLQIEYGHVPSSQADASGMPLSQGPGNGGAGNLGGSMVYYDSISSSIVGLISMADVRGAGSMDPIVIDESPLDSKQRVGWGASELRAIPTIRGSLTELGPALFGSGRQDEGKPPPRSTPAGTDAAVEEVPASLPVPIATTPFATPTSMPSSLPSREEKNAYNDVVDLIVSQDKSGRRDDEGAEWKKSPPHSRECPDEQIKVEHELADKRSAPKRKLEEEGAGNEPSLMTLRKKLKTEEWEQSEGDGTNHA